MAREDSEKINVRDLKIFNKIKNLFRERINNISKYYYDSLPQETEITDLIRRSIEFRESNSVIICGPPGCGKTSLVGHVLDKLEKENVITNDSAVVVHLNGLLHTDDRLALKYITRQLSLSEGCESVKTLSFQEHLVHLFDRLNEKKESQSTQTCTIFVLDEFHLFCNHKNQLLLYNLFDVAQSAKSPICILGLTSYTDVTDLLEKRVLSRFSHRVVWMQKTATIENRLNLFKNLFTFNDEDLFNIEKIYKIIWNGRVQVLVENQDVINAFKRKLDTTPSLNNFKNVMIKLLNSVTFQKPLLSAESIKEACNEPDFNVLSLSSLSLLETALVLAIKHQNLTYEKEAFNFEMIYSQYLKFAEKHSTTLVTERSVVLKGFQRLEEAEIIIPVKKTLDNNPGKIPLEYRLFNFNLTYEQVAEGVKLNNELPTDIKQWMSNAVY